MLSPASQRSYFTHAVGWANERRSCEATQRGLLPLSAHRVMQGMRVMATPCFRQGFTSSGGTVGAALHKGRVETRLDLQAPPQPGGPNFVPGAIGRMQLLLSSVINLSRNHCHHGGRTTPVSVATCDARSTAERGQPRLLA